MKSFKNFITEKSKLRDLDHDEFMKYGDNNPKGRADPEWNKERKRRYKNDMQRNRRKQVKEAKKKIHSVSNGKNRADVFKLTGADDEGDPFIVKLFKGGRHYEPADYYTDDKNDAIGTAKMMVKEEANPTSTADVVGTGDDVADWKDPKKKKRRPLTRHFIEVGGKRRKLTK